MSLDDLSEYAVEICDPLVGDYGDHRVWTSPLNTQGFLLLEILGAISTTDPTPDLLGSDGDVLARLFHEAVLDRERLIGDPRFGAPSLSEVLNDEYLSAMADRALNATARTSNVGEQAARSAPATGDTVAVVAADDDGYAACIIQSVFHSFGALILDPDTGIVMHNRGAFFSLDEASPNALAPGRRPGSTLMPVMVTTAEGDPAWVVGTMGGKGQPQIHTQVLLRLFRGATPSEAVSAPRWIVGGLAVGQDETTVHIEADVPSHTVDAITRSGMDIRVLPSHSESTGHAQVVELQGNRVVAAASDPRADGTGQVCDLVR
jgi:gamma-glutamyltranspeptidase/glutathione hydrolase